MAVIWISSPASYRMSPSLHSNEGSTLSLWEQQGGRSSQMPRGHVVGLDVELINARDEPRRCFKKGLDRR
jgi:hypothetical protein